MGHDKIHGSEHATGQPDAITAASIGGAPTVHTHLPADVTGTAVITSDVRLSDARVPLSHTHGNISNGGLVGVAANLPLITGAGGIVQAGSFGTGATDFCVGNDARLSDARTPLSHTHGNITNVGYIGTTATLPIITGTGGILQAGAFGTSAGQFCQGNDSRLSDARTPTAHTHGNITNTGYIGTTATLPIITGTGGILQAGAFGTGAGDFCQGNDSRLSDARTPTAHALGGSAHSADTIANFNSKISDLIATYGGIRDIGVGTLVQRPAFGTANRFFWTTDEQKLYRDTGSAWEAMVAAIASHSHSSASGSGAIATDQIAKFGDGGTANYAEIQTTGKFRSYGTGRFKRVQFTFSNGMTVGGTYTFDGASFGASTLVVISSTDHPSMFRAFDDASRQYALVETALPLDYVAGTDIEFCIAWAAAATTGSCAWKLGVLPVSDGDSFNTTPTYTALQNDTPHATSYGRKTKSITITGTGLNPGDCLSIVILRVASDASDTMTGSAMITSLGIKYISDKLGADV